MFTVRRWFRVAAFGFPAAVVSIGFAGCGGPASETPVTPVAEPRNVLIVLMDATAAGHMYPWGYPRDPAPNFRRIAKEGMLFLNAHSQSANTTPSVWSFMTGRYPYIPEPLGTYTTHRPYDDDYMMGDAFRGAGFRTAAFSENPWIHSKYGWDKGFDRFEYIPGVYDHQGLRWTRSPEATQHTLDSAREWIAAQGEGRWFCYVHLLRPHDPYDAPIKYTGRYTREPLRGHDHRRVEHVIREIAVATPGRLTQDDLKYMVDMYDANLRYVDDMVGQFYAALKKSGVTDDTLIVLMSDHGEAFMEHGELGHNTRAYEEMVHVPLAIIGPRGHGIARGAYGGLVDLVDLMPTFQELFGLDAPSPYPGRSLAGVLRGGTDSPRTRSISRSAVEHYRVAYREGDMKLIATVDAGYREVLGVELYDLGKDPGERNDLSEHVPLAGPLLEKLKEHLAQLERKDSTHDPVLSAEEKEQLESIGYGKSE